MCIVVLLCTLYATKSCSTGSNNNHQAALPLNITVYIDLSDRLERDMTPSQKERDLAVIKHVTELFQDSCINHKISRSKDHLKVLFYPAPANSEIAALASALEIDMSKYAPKERKQKLKDMSDVFTASLNQIYDETLQAKRWVGSDIWGFFSNKKVDDLCIRPGYRNILIILTDGYLYHANNKIKEGNSYSYVLPQTLSDPQSALIVRRTDLQNLEVIMLETNPYSPLQHDRLNEVLSNWFNNMGVSKFVISDTDMPTNTITVLDNFIGR